MAIPPSFEQPEMSRPYFAMVPQVAEHGTKPGVYMRELDGHVNDQVAIEEGATMVGSGGHLRTERSLEEVRKSTDPPQTIISQKEQDSGAKSRRGAHQGLSLPRASPGHIVASTG
jgi:hypothetical protein